MNLKKIIYFIFILFFIINIMNSSVVFAASSGTNTPEQRSDGALPNDYINEPAVIIGDLAFDLYYANIPNNKEEITQAIVNSNGQIYIVVIPLVYIVDNTTGETIKPTDDRVRGKLVKLKVTSNYTYNTFITPRDLKP